MSFNFDGDGQGSGRAASSSPGFNDSDYSLEDSGWGSHDSGTALTDADTGAAAQGSLGFTLDGGDTFTGQGADHWQSTAAVPPGKPPMPFFYAGLGLSLIGVAAAFLLQQSWFGLALGWVLAGPIAILALGRYVEQDSAQRTRPIYQGGAATRHYPMILGTVALACVVIVAVLAAGKAALAW